MNVLLKKRNPRKRKPVKSQRQVNALMRVLFLGALTSVYSVGAANGTAANGRTRIDTQYDYDSSNYGLPRYPYNVPHSTPYKRERMIQNPNGQWVKDNTYKNDGQEPHGAPLRTEPQIWGTLVFDGLTISQQYCVFELYQDLRGRKYKYMAFTEDSFGSIIFVKLFNADGAPIESWEHQGKYDFIRDLSSQERRQIKQEYLIYSDGTSVYTPNITQELWENVQKGQVRFFIATKGNRINGFPTQLQEGLWEFVSVQETPQGIAEEIWRKYGNEQETPVPVLVPRTTPSAPGIPNLNKWQREQQKQEALNRANLSLEPVQHPDYAKHYTTERIIYKKRLEGQWAPLHIKERTEHHHLLRKETPQVHAKFHFDGKTVYQRRHITEHWQDPITQETYRAVTFEPMGIQTHPEGQKIIYISPLNQNNDDLNLYKGEYDFLHDLEPQNKKRIHEGRCIYSDGKHVYLPFITQERWQRQNSNEKPFSFFIASQGMRLKQQIKYAMFPEGLYELENITLNPNGNGAYDQEAWRRFANHGGQEKTVTILVPRGLSSIFEIPILPLEQLEQLPDEEELRKHLKQTKLLACDLVRSFQKEKKDFKQLVANLLEHPDHETLTLEECGLGYNNIPPLALHLNDFKHLKFLSLEGNSIGSKALKMLVESLSNNRTLVSIKLGKNYLHDEGAQEVASILTRNQTLRVLSLKYAAIGNDGLEKIALALRGNTTLQSLNLKQNCFNSEGGIFLGALLASEQSALTHLNASYNNLSVAGIETISQSLRSNLTLQSLNLAGTGVDDKSVSMIFTGVFLNKTLKSLNLENNRIGPEGGSEIWKLLQANSSLTALNLHHNYLANRGVTGIASALANNTTLRSLDLSANCIAEDGASALIELLDHNTSLVFLNTEGNWEKKEQSAEIESRLRRNNVNWNNVRV